MPIYMQIDGIKGSVTETKHKDWIQLNSFQWGVGRAISSPVGNTSDRESSAPSLSEISVTKELDIASVGLFHMSLGGAEGKDVTLDFVQTGTKEAGRVYLQLKLSQVLISGYSVSSGGDRPSESVSLNYTKIHEEYTPAPAENKPGTSTKAEYDLSKGEVTV